MSFLSEELERQFEAAATNPFQLGERIGVSPSQIYKWLRDEQTSISADQLRAIAEGTSKNVNDHAALVRAHLLDEKFGPGSHLVRIEVDSPETMNDQPRPRSKGERAMLYLAEARIKSRAINDLVVDLARCLGGEP